MWQTQRQLPSPSLSLLQHPSASSYFSLDLTPLPLGDIAFTVPETFF
jgi:hypothetical protein